MRALFLPTLSRSHLFECGTSATVAAALGAAKLHGADARRKLERALALLHVGVAGAGADKHEHLCLAAQRVLQEVRQFRVSEWRVLGL